MRHCTSDIGHRKSDISWNQTSDIRYQSSEHRTSHIRRHKTSDSGHRTSEIRSQTSEMGHQTDDVKCGKNKVSVCHWCFLYHISCSLGILKLSRTLSFLYFSTLQIAPAKFFWSLSLAQSKIISKIFKTARHVEQNKENKFPVTSSMYLCFNRSWVTTNHSARGIHIIVL